MPLAVTALGVWDDLSLRWLRGFSNVCAAATSVSSGMALTSLMTNDKAVGRFVARKLAHDSRRAGERPIGVDAAVYRRF